MRFNTVHRFRRTLGMFVGVVLIAACGGDDDDDYASALAAVFEDHEDALNLFGPWRNLQNICAIPRPDDARGTAVDEKRFLRSYSHDTYLWYDEIKYIDPDDERHSVLEYFELMKTTEQTPSGKFKDDFHFAIPTDVWQMSVSSGITNGFGFEDAIAFLGDDVVILYVEPGSPADRSGLSRGSRIVSLEPVGSDGQSLEARIRVRNPGSTTARTLMLRTADYTVDPVRLTRAIDTDTGPVGYLFFKDHNVPSEQQLIDAFRQLAEAEVTDLVLDLRYNGGGISRVANQTAFMIAGSSAASGKVFQRPRFNDKHPSINPITLQPIDPGHFATTAAGLSARAGTPLPSLNLSRVFILTTNGTCSASEAIINGLRGIDVEVVLIGDTTCGKPYGFYDVDNCGTTYLTIQVTGTNHKGFGNYADGFSPQNAVGPGSVSVPGCAVADDPEHALGDENEGQLAAALRYRIDGNCPPPSRLAVKPMALGDAPRAIGIMTMH